MDKIAFFYELGHKMTKQAATGISATDILFPALGVGGAGLGLVRSLTKKVRDIGGYDPIEHTIAPAMLGVGLGGLTHMATKKLPLSLAIGSIPIVTRIPATIVGLKQGKPTLLEHLTGIGAMKRDKMLGAEQIGNLSDLAAIIAMGMLSRGKSVETTGSNITRDFVKSLVVKPKSNLIN